MSIRTWTGGALALVATFAAACVATSCTAQSSGAEPKDTMQEPTVATGGGCMAKTDEEWRAELTPEQYRILRRKGTEMAFTGEYWKHKGDGVYRCAACGTPLFDSKTKYKSGTGWPSFYAPYANESVGTEGDRSHGMYRDEVVCSHCGGHLGHVFDDGPAPTGQRFCINSGALSFQKRSEFAAEEAKASASTKKMDGMKSDAGVAAMKKPAMPERETAIFGAGCFWGVEAAFRKLPGVTATAVGYSGGVTKGPTYKQVCTDRTGHAEVVRVEFDPSKVSYERLLDVFWSVHNPTQGDRQGWDVGKQYRSAIFYLSGEQKRIAEKSKAKLAASGRYRRRITTEITKAGPFYKAEEYHQQYYEKRGGGAGGCALPR